MTSEATNLAKTMAKFQFRDRNIPILLLGVIGCLFFCSSTTAFVTNHPRPESIVSSAVCMSQKDTENISGKAKGTISNNDEAVLKSPRSTFFLKNAFKSVVTFSLACSLALPSFASDSSSLLVGKQYWTIMDEGACMI